MSSLVAETSRQKKFLVMLTGAFIWVLNGYLGREKSMVVEASLLTEASLVPGLDASVHV